MSELRSAAFDAARAVQKRPSQHESWCAEWGYEDCTCDLEVRQVQWDRENREQTAAELPRATAKFRRNPM